MYFFFTTGGELTVKTLTQRDKVICKSLWVPKTNFAFMWANVLFLNDSRLAVVMDGQTIYRGHFDSKKILSECGSVYFL